MKTQRRLHSPNCFAGWSRLVYICNNCGADRRYRFDARGRQKPYPWHLDGKPTPYCVKP